MDVEKALRELYQEKKRVDAAIAVLETRLKVSKGARSKPAVERRGRKGMSAEERQEVSKRMAKYWQERRAQQQALGAEPPAAGEEPATEEPS